MISRQGEGTRLRAARRVSGSTARRGSPGGRAKLNLVRRLFSRGLPGLFLGLLVGGLVGLPRAGYTQSNLTQRQENVPYVRYVPFYKDNMGPLKHYRNGSAVRHKELVKSFMRWGIKTDAPLLWLTQQTGATEQQQVSPIGRSDFLVSQVSVSDDGQVAALHGHVNAGWSRSRSIRPQWMRYRSLSGLMNGIRISGRT